MLAFDEVRAGQPGPVRGLAHEVHYILYLQGQAILTAMGAKEEAKKKQRADSAPNPQIRDMRFQIIILMGPNAAGQMATGQRLAGFLGRAC